MNTLPASRGRGQHQGPEPVPVSIWLRAQLHDVHLRRACHRPAANLREWQSQGLGYNHQYRLPRGRRGGRDVCPSRNPSSHFADSNAFTSNPENPKSLRSRLARRNFQSSMQPKPTRSVDHRALARFMTGRLALRCGPDGRDPHESRPDGSGRPPLLTTSPQTAIRGRRKQAPAVR